MVRNIPDKRQAQRHASLDMLSRDHRFAVMRFVAETDADVGAAILGVRDDEDMEMNPEAHCAYEGTCFGC